MRRRRPATSWVCQKPASLPHSSSSRRIPLRPPKLLKPPENMPPTQQAIDSATSPLLRSATHRALKKLTERRDAPSDGPKASRFQNGTVHRAGADTQMEGDLFSARGCEM